MSKKSCVIYDSWADQIINLPPEMAGEYAQAILQYAIYGEEMEISNPAIYAMMIPVKKKLDEDDETYRETIRQRSEAGKRGMAKRWNEKAITNDNEVITNDNTVINEITKITESESGFLCPIT